MPQPTASDVHVNRPLTEISEAFRQESDSFVAGRVFPEVPVAKQSDQYFKYTKADWLRSDAQERQPGSESAGSGWNLTTDTYNAKVYAIHKDIDDQIRANADAPLDMDRDAALWTAQQLLIKRDKVWAADYFTTGKWGSDRTGVASGPTGTQFLQFDKAGSDPIGEITNDIVEINRKTGKRPNKLVLGAKTFNELRNHPDVIDRIKHTQRGITTLDILASLLFLDEVMVAWGVEETAAEGATAAPGYIVDQKAALLVFAAPSPSLLMPSGGYTFTWTGLLGSSPGGMRTKSFRMEQLAADRVEGEMAFATKLVSADLGVFYASAVA